MASASCNYAQLDEKWVSWTLDKAFKMSKCHHSGKINRSFWRNSATTIISAGLQKADWLTHLPIDGAASMDGRAISYRNWAYGTFKTSGWQSCSRNMRPGKGQKGWIFKGLSFLTGPRRKQISSCGAAFGMDFGHQSDIFLTKTINFTPTLKHIIPL